MFSRYEQFKKEVEALQSAGGDCQELRDMMAKLEKEYKQSAQYLKDKQAQEREQRNK